MDIWTPSFHPDLVKTEIKKSSLCTQISPSWWLGKYWIQKSSLSLVYAPRFQPVDDWENTRFKILSFSQVYSPRFHPVDFQQWSLSRVKVAFESIYLNSWLVKTGIQKVKFKSSLCTQISPSWWLGKYWIQKVEFMHQDFTHLISEFHPQSLSHVKVGF